MRVLIVDDERLARAELRRLLAPHAGVEIVGEAANVAEAEEAARRLRPELLLLDIKMPGGTGFDLLERLDAVPQVIFLTAYDEFALRAFEVNALDYLLKPVSPERLAEALGRVRQAESMRVSPRPVCGDSKNSDEAGVVSSHAPDSLDAPLGGGQRIFLRDGERCWFVRLSEIVLLESEGNYTRLYFAGERCLIPRSLQTLEERLDPQLFFRASRRHMVNLRAITQVTPSVAGGFDVLLDGGLRVEMSRRRSLEFRARMSL